MKHLQSGRQFVRQRPSARRGLLRASAASLSLSLILAGCLGMPQPRLASLPTPNDPPPIPQRKPAALIVRPALADAGSVLQRTIVTPRNNYAVQNAAYRRVPTARTAVTAVPLAPARKSKANSLAVPQHSARRPTKNESKTTPQLDYGTIYRARPGDTVYAVGRRFGVSARTIIEVNRLPRPYTLRIGQVLRIPNPHRHTVRRGDTVYGVARRYGVNVEQLARLNGIKAPYRIATGQDLILPGAKAITGQGVTRVAAYPRTQIATAQGSTSPVTRATGAILKPPPRVGGKFHWPVRGRTIAGYGPKKDGRHNDGINIAAPRGTPIRAAENGVVAYVGNELRGFGNLLLIKHAGGWVTAYAHTDQAFVRRGDLVTRGQIIAHIGSTGNVAKPQLHFEIRKGSRSVDPARFLSVQRASLQ